MSVDSDMQPANTGQDFSSRGNNVRVSVVLVGRNSGNDALACVQSALRQTCREIEVVYVDQGSTDGSLATMEELARRDARLRMFALTNDSQNAFEMAIDEARGEWIAGLDPCDIMHPQRLEKLLAVGERAQADLVADHVLVFSAGPDRRAELLFRSRTDEDLGLASFINLSRLRENGFPGGGPKPLMRRRRLVELSNSGVGPHHADERLESAVRLLARGSRFVLISDVLLFQRRSEPRSLRSSDRDSMLAASARLRDLIVSKGDKAALAALDARVVDLQRASATSPQRPVSAQAERVQSSGGYKQATIISRQRIVGSTNGSSAYVLSLASGLRDQGWRVTLLAPTPKTLGRLPFVRLRPEMKVFHEIRMRGCIRVGDTLVRPDMAAYWRAGVGIAGRVARRLGVKAKWASERPLPHSISLPWEIEDLLFIANETPPSDVLLADYLFQTFALPFALQPEAKSYVIMHDLYSKRAEDFGGQARSDSIAAMSEATEVGMLDQADTVIAIQPEEAEWVRARLPGKSVISVPMPARLAAAPQPGDSQQILFVGSNTAPNVIALEWWFNEIWPKVMARNPTCETIVAGSVINASLARPARTQFLGIVPDLDPLYARVGVVISPLTVGSGLKIKLIDALGMGKAIVATTTTLEGAPPDIVAAVRVTDDADVFADHVVELLSDARLRENLAASALHAAREHYSVQACHADLYASLTG